MLEQERETREAVVELQVSAEPNFKLLVLIKEGKWTAKKEPFLCDFKAMVPGDLSGVTWGLSEICVVFTVSLAPLIYHNGACVIGRSSWRSQKHFLVEYLKSFLWILAGTVLQAVVSWPFCWWFGISQQGAPAIHHTAVTAGCCCARWAGSVVVLLSKWFFLSMLSGPAICRWQLGALFTLINSVPRSKEDYGGSHALFWFGMTSVGERAALFLSGFIVGLRLKNWV